MSEDPDKRTAKQKAWDEAKAADPRRAKLAAKRRARQADQIIDSVMESAAPILRARR